MKISLFLLSFLIIATFSSLQAVIPESSRSIAPENLIRDSVDFEQNEIIETQQKLDNVHQSLQKLAHDGDLDRDNWKKIGGEIKAIGTWIQEKLRENNQETKAQVRHLEDRINTLKIIAPAWRAQAVAQERINTWNKSTPSNSLFERLFCWLKSTPFINSELVQGSLKEAATAWKNASGNLNKQMQKFPEALRVQIEHSQGRGNSRLHGDVEPVAQWMIQPFLDTMSYVAYAKERLEIEIKLREYEGKIANGETEEVLKNQTAESFTEGLQAIKTEIERSPSLQIQKKNLEYIIAFYQARFASCQYDDLFLHAHNPEEIEEASVQGKLAVSFWEKAIEAKKEVLKMTLDETSYYTLYLYMNENQTGYRPSLTPEQEAAKNRLVELEAQKQAILHSLGEAQNKAAHEEDGESETSSLGFHDPHENYESDNESTFLDVN